MVAWMFGRKVSILWLRIAFLVMIPFASAPAAVSGNFTYQVVGAEIVITDFPTGFSGAVEVPATIAGLPVTQIGHFAFADCTRITSVTMPDTVVSVGSRSFHNCQRLVSVSLSQGLVSIASTAFENCHALTSISLPSSLQSIGTQAFLYCTGLTSIHIPAGVVTFGQIPFSGCTALAEVTVDAANPNFAGLDGVLYNKAFTALIQCPAGKTGALVIPEGVTSIPQYGVSRAAHLTQITLPSTITSLGTGAFQYCTSLVSINLPPGITEIPAMGFFNCASLIEVAIPDGVTTVSGSAFLDCISLVAIRIPASVTNLNDSALEGCLFVSEIDLDPANISYVMSQNALFDAAMSKLIRCETGRSGDFTIPAGVGTILPGAFANCSDLAGVAIPSSVTTIGGSAFKGCESLLRVTIPVRHCGRWGQIFPGVSTVEELLIVPSAGVSYLGLAPESPLESLMRVVIQPGAATVIGDYSFRGSVSLAEVELPAGLEEIGRHAFDGCVSLEEIEIPPTVTTLGSYAFNECTSLRSFGSLDGITLIPEGAFHGCEALRELEIPASVVDIFPWAFSGCTGISELTIPPSVQFLRSGSFGYCAGLRELTISKSTSVENAFDGSPIVHVRLLPGEDDTVVDGNWVSIERLTLGEGFTEIAPYAFSNAWQATLITIPASVTKISASAFLESPLPGVVFLGDAPESDAAEFWDVLPQLTVYYFDDAEGFTSPLWRGVPAVNLGARTSLGLWKARNHFSPDVAMDSDPLESGVQLLMAYALGLDPHRSGVADLPAVEVSAGALSMEFYAGTPGITYSVETSDNLETWSVEGVVISPPDAGGFRMATYEGNGPNRFMRLVVND